MNTIKKIADIIIGYSGSSEKPEQMSLRLSSIIVGIISKIAAICAIAGFVLPYTTPQIQFAVSLCTLVFASITWAFGLVRAIVSSFKARAV